MVPAVRRAYHAVSASMSQASDWLIYFLPNALRPQMINIINIIVPIIYRRIIYYTLYIYICVYIYLLVFLYRRHGIGVISSRPLPPPPRPAHCRNNIYVYSEHCSHIYPSKLLTYNMQYVFYIWMYINGV